MYLILIFYFPKLVFNLTTMEHFKSGQPFQNQSGTAINKSFKIQYYAAAKKDCKSTSNLIQNNMCNKLFSELNTFFPHRNSKNSALNLRWPLQ